MAKKAICPTCRESFDLEKELEVGDTTQCPACYEDLKVISLDPPVIEAAGEDEEENYDDDEEEDYGRDRKEGDWL